MNIACQWNDDNLSDTEKEEYCRQEAEAAKILRGKFLTIGNRNDLIFLESKEMECTPLSENIIFK